MKEFYSIRLRSELQVAKIIHCDQKRSQNAGGQNNITGRNSVKGVELITGKELSQLLDIVETKLYQPLRQRKSGYGKFPTVEEGYAPAKWQH